MKKIDQTTLRISALKHLSRGQKAEALEDLKSLISADGNAVDAYVVGGIILREMGEFDRAIRAHLSVLEKSDLTPETKAYIESELATDYNLLGDYKSTLVLTESKQLHLLPYRAEALEKTGHERIAAEVYEKSARLDINYKKNAARCWYQASFDVDADAIKYLKYAEKNDPTFFDAKFRHAKLYYSENKKIRAGWVIDEIINSELPCCGEHMALLEELYYEYFDVDKLYNLIMQKINGGSSNCAFYEYAANYHIRKGDDEKAKTIISLFTEKHGQRAVFLAIYAQMSSDRLFKEYFEEKNQFKCTACNAEFKEYQDKCSVCSSLGTLSYF
jgi:hypothetical protein